MCGTRCPAARCSTGGLHAATGISRLADAMQQPANVGLRAVGAALAVLGHGAQPSHDHWHLHAGRNREVRKLYRHMYTGCRYRHDQEAGATTGGRRSGTVRRPKANWQVPPHTTTQADGHNKALHPNVTGIVVARLWQCMCSDHGQQALACCNVLQVRGRAARVSW